VKSKRIPPEVFCGSIRVSEVTVVPDREATGDRHCSRCLYWRLLDANPNQGECRRYAPKPDAFESIHMMATWPITNIEDWCGEFKELPAGTGPGGC